MKTRMIQISRVMLLVTTFIVFAENACAFYNPHAQRWINRDPIDETGFESVTSSTGSLPYGNPNDYLFTDNQSVTQVDPWGLKCDCGLPNCHPKPKPNGCSSPDKGKPKDLPGLDFNPACNAHDICYQTCGSKRAQCDKDFLRDLKRICDQTYPTGNQRNLCYRAAQLYYDGVRLGGEIAFRKDQEEACKCTCKE